MTNVHLQNTQRRIVKVVLFVLIVKFFFFFSWVNTKIFHFLKYNILHDKIKGKYNLKFYMKFINRNFIYYNVSSTTCLVGNLSETIVI